MKLINVLFCVSMTSNLFCQDVDKYFSEKIIKTTGYSEIILEPTSFIIELIIQETILQPKDYNQPAYINNSIDALENNLKKWVTEVGISTKDLTQIFIGSINNSYNGRNIQLIYEKYELKVKNYSDLVKITKSTKFNGFFGFRILRKFDINNDDTMNKLYVSALKNAKSKTEHLLSSANKTIGDILLIDMNIYHDRSEIDDLSTRGYNYGNSMDGDLQRQKKISVSVAVTYEIK